MVGIIIIALLVLLAMTAFFIMSKKFILAFITGALFFVSFVVVVFLRPWAFVDNYELGYKFDRVSGNIQVLDRPGYHWITPILETVHTIDTRPRQVCINVGGDTQQGASSANRRVLNCKLVQFNPEGLTLFLDWHGRGDYNGNMLDDLLKIYAYDGSGKGYPFLNVLRELKGEEDFDFGSADAATPAPVEAAAGE